MVKCTMNYWQMNSETEANEVKKATTNEHGNDGKCETTLWRENWVPGPSFPRWLATHLATCRRSGPNSGLTGEWRWSVYHWSNQTSPFSRGRRNNSHKWLKQVSCKFLIKLQMFPFKMYLYFLFYYSVSLFTAYCDYFKSTCSTDEWSNSLRSQTIRWFARYFSLGTVL